MSVYLDMLKETKNLKNDSEVGNKLKVTRSYISQIRSGSFMSDEKCYELAILINIEPIELLSINRAIREGNKPVSKYWMEIHYKSK